MSFQLHFKRKLNTNYFLPYLFKMRNEKHLEMELRSNIWRNWNNKTHPYPIHGMTSIVSWKLSDCSSRELCITTLKSCGTFTNIKKSNLGKQKRNMELFQIISTDLQNYEGHQVWPSCWNRPSSASTPEGRPSWWPYRGWRWSPPWPLRRFHRLRTAPFSVSF